MLCVVIAFVFRAKWEKFTERKMPSRARRKTNIRDDRALTSNKSNGILEVTARKIINAYIVRVANFRKGYLDVRIDRVDKNSALEDYKQDITLLTRSKSIFRVILTHSLNVTSAPSNTVRRVLGHGVLCDVNRKLQSLLRARCARLKKHRLWKLERHQIGDTEKSNSSGENRILSRANNGENDTSL